MQCAHSASELDVTVQSVSMVAVYLPAINSMEQLGHSLCSIESAVHCSFLCAIYSVLTVEVVYIRGGIYVSFEISCLHY